MLKRNRRITVLTDEEVHFYGELYQKSNEKEQGLSFYHYLNKQIEEKSLIA